MCDKRDKAVSYVFCRDLHLTSMFSGRLPKDLFKGKWILAKSYFRQNYCHACHTRFAVFFPLPSCCVSLLISHNGSSSCIFHVIYRKHSNGCHQGAMTISYPFKPQYPHTNSPNWSLYISIKNKLRGLDKRSMHFLFSDHFTNSHNLFSWLCIVTVRRQLMFVTLGA